jgi:hypothetical protein
MKKLKEIVRLLLFGLLLIIASFGLGFAGSLFGTKERYQNNEIRIEMVEKKEDEEGESDEVKN